MTTSPLKVEDSRAQFEAEFRKLGNIVDMRRAKNGDEEYMAWDVALAWRFWQASRAAIVVDTGYLLGDEDNEDSDYTIVFNQGIAKADKAIRAAGITVKGDE